MVKAVRKDAVHMCGLIISSDKSFFTRMGKWFRDMKSELKLVQWPTRKQTINNTLIVIACVVVVGIFIALFDFVANQAISLLLGR